MDQTAKITKFTDLFAWKESHKLVLKIYEITKTFPDFEKYGLADQMRRAAVSITSNIAEGFSRNSNLEKRQFYHLSKGSLTEIENQIIISHDIGYISKETELELQSLCETSGKLISAMLRFINSRI